MKETYEENDCARAGQLVGYIYDESDARERADFERHLRDCASCRDEVAAFTHVRGSVAEFRDELLRAAPAVSLDGFAAGAGAKPLAARAQSVPTGSQASPSAESGQRPARGGFAPNNVAPRASAGAAWAALREFFRLSPAWLRVTTAAAAFALCALALLAVANAEISFGDRRFTLRTWARPTAPSESAPAVPSPARTEELTAMQSQLGKLKMERDAALRELEEAREQLDDSRSANLVAAEFDADEVEGATPSPRDTRRQRRASPACSAARTERGAKEEGLNG
jgi:hypothetical protein